MQVKGQVRRRPVPLRIRLLSGVLAPSIIVLVAVTLLSAGSIGDATHHRDSARVLDQVAGQAIGFFPLITAERDAGLRYRAVPTPTNRAALDRARAAVDRTAQEIGSSVAALIAGLPARVRGPMQAFGAALTGLPAARGRIDDGTADLLAVYRSFLPLSESQHYCTYVMSTTAGDADVANRLGRAADLLRAGELLSRANSLLSSALLADDLTDAQVTAVFTEFNDATGAYRGLLDAVTPLLDEGPRTALTELRAGPQWRVVESAATAIFDSGPPGPGRDGRRSVPTVDPRQLGEASRAVAARITELGLLGARDAGSLEATRAEETLTVAVLTAVAVLVGLVVAIVIAGLVTAHLIRRLARLRRRTLALADVVLPDVVARLRRGERVDIDTEVPPLAFGLDEIGQVASAFNLAQRTAVQAAIEEAHTRAGFNAAFLDIARRSQTILHRQLEVLDQVQRTETDPEQLDLLVQLDHLAVMERRNAENLIILGGGQPRRHRRHPIPLTELVRGAVGEAEHHQRVTVRPLPEVHLTGPAVDDLVHLLAELVDNATTFSPAGAPIEIRAAVVGRGIAVEIEDHGPGIDDHQLDQLNERLRNPPDFSLFTLSEDAGIGLFVVAWLGRKHGVTVDLRPSVYGGVRAGVLVPDHLLVTEDSVPSRLTSRY